MGKCGKLVENSFFRAILGVTAPISRIPLQKCVKAKRKGRARWIFCLKADFIGSVSAFIAKNGMRRAADGEKFLLQPTS